MIIDTKAIVVDMSGPEAIEELCAMRDRIEAIRRDTRGWVPSVHEGLRLAKHGLEAAEMAIRRAQP